MSEFQELPIEETPSVDPTIIAQVPEPNPEPVEPGLPSLFREKRPYVKKAGERFDPSIVAEIHAMPRSDEKRQAVVNFFETYLLYKSSWRHKWADISFDQKYVYAYKQFNWWARYLQQQYSAVPDYTIANPSPYNLDGDTFAYVMMTQMGPEFATQYQHWRKIENDLDYGTLRSSSDVEEAVHSVFSNPKELIDAYMANRAKSTLQQRQIMAVLVFMLRTCQNMSKTDVKKLLGINEKHLDQLLGFLETNQFKSKKIVTRIRQACQILIKKSAKKILKDNPGIVNHH